MTGERFAFFLQGRAKPGLAVTAFILATLLLVITSLVLVAGSANRSEAQRAREATSLEVSNILDQLRRLTSDYPFWDDAVRYLVEEPNLTWADENFGSHLANQYDIDATYVVAPTGDIQLAFVDGQSADPGSTPFSKTDLAPLIRAVPPSKGVQFAAGTVLAVDGQAYFTYASRISGSSAEGKLRPASGTHFIVLQRRLGEAMLEKLRREAGAVAVRVAPDHHDHRTEAAGILPEILGAPALDVDMPPLEVPPAVHIEVVPRSPGLGILADILLPFSLMLMGLSGFGALLVRSVRRMQRQQRVLERARLAAEKASRAKTEFLATITHELRTPLNTVIGFADVLAGGADSALSAEQLDYVRDIRSSGEHLLAIINDLLDMSRIEADALVLQEGVFDLGRLVTTTVRLMREQAQSLGVSLEAIALDESMIVRADERLIRQVLLNIISNALKFTERGGTVRVEVERSDDGDIRTTVEDTGIGISAEQLTMIFKPFYQIDSSLARKRGGTGLGLAISKAIMKLHGGNLDIASQAGLGTTTTVVIPATRAVVAQDGYPAAA